MTIGRSIRPGVETTLQFHPSVGLYELVGSAYPLWPPSAMAIEEATKTLFVDFDMLPIGWEKTPPYSRLVLQRMRALGPHHSTVKVLGEFG